MISSLFFFGSNFQLKVILDFRILNSDFETNFIKIRSVVSEFF